MDKLQIINMALMKCGLPLAAALNDCDWNAAYVYDHSFELLLRSYTWGFATEFKSLAQSGKPVHGFEKAYQIPDDCLRVIDVHCAQDLRSPKARNTRVVGKLLYAQISPCYLRYITRNIDIEDCPPDFCDALACQIAFQIAALSTQLINMVPQLKQLAAVSLAEAQATDARENTERVPHDYNIMAARMSGGDGRGR